MFRRMSYDDKLAAAALGAICLLLATLMWLYDSQPAVRQAIKNLTRAVIWSPVILYAGAFSLVRMRQPRYAYKARHAR